MANGVALPSHEPDQQPSQLSRFIERGRRALTESIGEHASSPGKPSQLSTWLTRIELGSEADQFLENLALLLGSGMDLLVAITALEQDARSGAMKRMTAQFRSDIDDGRTLSEAFVRANVFPEYVVSLIRIGEQSGRLAENLRVVAEEQQKERFFRSKVASAMIYPLLVLAVTAIVGVLIAWFVLPRLVLVFDQLKVELPLITQALLWFGQFLAQWGWVAIPTALFAVGTLTYVIFFAQKTRIIGEKLLIALPGTSQIMREIELSRFGYILGHLLKAGLPLLDALRSLKAASSFALYGAFYEQLIELIDEGNSFKKSFERIEGSTQLIPYPIQQLIVSAEQSGQLPEALIKLGATYEEKSEVTSKNLVILLEPILLVLVWLGVVFVAIAIILPIYKLVGDFSAASSGEAPSAQTSQQEVDTPIASHADGIVLGAATTSGIEQGARWIITIDGTQNAATSVYAHPSNDRAALGEVHADDSFIAFDYDRGWYQIALPSGTRVWVPEPKVNATRIGKERHE